MKRREFFLVNLLLTSLVAVTGLATVRILTNQSVSDLVTQSVLPGPSAAALAATAAGACSKQPELSLQADGDANLGKLADYQQACHSYVTDTLMVFTGFPHDQASAQKESQDMAAKLKLFAQNKVTPLVVAEPYDDNGLVSYNDFKAGKYTDSLSAYFNGLKAAGVTDQMMGTWVPFPESNTPSWNNKDTEPNDFALCVNVYLGAMKKVFPQAKGSVLLDATTYDPNDTGWNNGDYLSLIPYLQSIDKSLVSSFGIEGFPWMSNATVAKPQQVFRASEFLQPDLAIAAAQELHTRDIWINTGSFASKYTNDPSQTVHVSLDDRKAILDGVLEVAKQIQNYQLNSYRVSINLFAEDKSKDAEATDWSYFQTPDSTTLLTGFLQVAGHDGVPVSIYDKAR